MKTESQELLYKALKTCAIRSASYETTADEALKLSQSCTNIANALVTITLNVDK